MADIDETKPNFPGIWPAVVTINRPAVPHQVQYGRLGDATYTLPGLMRPSYQPQFEGATCAGCHQDKNDPDGNGNFEEANGIISEPTWLEWLASPYSDETSPNYASCVDCHMPPSGASTVSPLSGLQRPLDTIRSHRIEGTSPAFLENAVDMSLSVQPGTTDIQVTVDVANTMTGHHVPTGVTVRNMILLVEAWRVQDGQRLTKTGGQVIHALGGVGAPEQGYYAGLPGKLYAKHNHNAAGNGPTFFTDATGILWDNRIPALTTDTTSYTFSPPPGGGDIAVRARLIYRRSFRFLTDAKGWTTTGHGDPLEDIAAPYFGHLMEEEVWTNSTTGPVEIFGTGCGGLVATSSGSPSLGLHSFEVQLAGALAATPAVLLFGNSRTQWGSLSLPHDLGFLGAPNCQLLVSPDMSWIHTTDFQGNATQAFAVPIIPAFAGVTFHAQWITPHGGNSIGWAFSNGLSITAQP